MGGDVFALRAGDYSSSYWCQMEWAARGHYAGANNTAQTVLRFSDSLGRLRTCAKYVVYLMSPSVMGCAVGDRVLDWGSGCGE